MYKRLNLPKPSQLKHPFFTLVVRSLEEANSIHKGGGKDRDMPVYGPQFKEQLVKKMMPPHNQSLAKISCNTGVAVPTLYS